MDSHATLMIVVRPTNEAGLCRQPWFLLCKSGRDVEWHSITLLTLGSAVYCKFTVNRSMSIYPKPFMVVYGNYPSCVSKTVGGFTRAHAPPHALHKTCSTTSPSQHSMFLLSACRCYTLHAMWGGFARLGRQLVICNTG